MGHPGFWVVVLHLFWENWPKNPSNQLELQPLRAEVDHPFQWPHFTGNNNQHLCNALGQGQTHSCQQGPLWSLQSLKLEACLVRMVGNWSTHAWVSWRQLMQSHRTLCFQIFPFFSKEAGNLKFFLMLALNDMILYFSQHCMGQTKHICGPTRAYGPSVCTQF